MADFNLGTAKGYIEIDSSGVAKSAQSASRSVGSSLNSMGRTISNAGRRMTFGLTLPIVGFGVAAFKAFTDSQKVIAQTDAVIKSTGGAANVTGKQVATLGTKIMEYSGFSDEAVASGENMLLTFTNIRNEVGKNNDIFTQSTKVLADMSTALGSDMSQQAIQLGKALNDPIRGITALTRVGVTFTDQQRKQITKMVEAGDTMKAQQLILAELNNEFGGSAKAAGETAAGAFNIAKEEIGNSMEQIGASIATVAVPLFQKLASVIQVVVDWFTKLPKGLQTVILIILAVVAAAGPLAIVIGALATVLGVLISPIGAVIAGLALLVAWWVKSQGGAENLLKSLKRIWNQIGPAIGEGVKAAIKWITDLVGFLTKTFEPAISKVVELAMAIWNTFGQNFIAIVKAVVAFVGPAIKDLAIIISNIIQFIVNVLTGKWGAAWDNIKAVFGAALDFILKSASATFKVLAAVIGAALKIIAGIFKAIWNGIKAFVLGVIRLIVAGIKLEFSVAKTIITTVLNVIKAVFVTIWNAIRTVVMGIWNAITTGIRTSINAVKSIIQGVMHVISSIWRGAWEGIKAVATGIWGAVTSAASSALGFIKSIINDIIGGINLLIKGINLVKPGADLGYIPTLAEGVRNFMGGLAMVGERGPEMVFLPKGSDVIPNRLMSSIGSSTASPISQMTAILQLDGITLQRSVQLTARENRIRLGGRV